VYSGVRPCVSVCSAVTTVHTGVEPCLYV